MTRVSAGLRPSTRDWIAVAAAWIGGLALLVVWLIATPPGHLREELKVLQVWSLDACVLLALLVGISILRWVPWRSSGRIAAPLVALVLLGLSLVLFVAPRTNRIFYDEQIYESIGQNIADLRLAQVCDDGSVEYGRLQCAYGEYNKQPDAYPHLLSLAYRAFGVRDGVAFGVNAAVMALTICVVYVLVLVLFADRTAACFAGLLLALTPQQILWSATAAVEPSASLAAAAAVLAAAWYVRTGGTASLLAVATASAYAIQFRPESILILPVVALIAWPRLSVELQRPRGWWGAVLFLALGAVHAAHLFSVRHAGWGTEGARFSLAYVAENLRANGWFYLRDPRFPALFTVLAVAGAAARAARRERWSIALYFLLFFGVDLLFYAGSYNYGADVRYSLMTYPPIAILGGLGAARFSRAAARRAPAVPAAAVIAAILLFQFLSYAPGVRATTEEAWAARADVRFAKTVAGELPRDAYVLTQNPGMFQVWGVSAGQMSRALASPAYARWLQQRYTGGVYVHWNFWCNVQEPQQPDLCRRVLALGTSGPIREFRERDQRYAFYRLAMPAAP